MVVKASESGGGEITRWPRWGAGLVLTSIGLFVAGLVTLPMTTSLEPTGSGCAPLVIDTPAPFILFGLASLALALVPIIMASQRRAGQSGNSALAALLVLTLLMGLLLQAAAPFGFFFVFYFVVGALIYLPLVWVLVRVRAKFSDAHRGMALVVLTLLFAYPWLAFAVAPHPILSC